MKHGIQNVFTVRALPDDPPKGEINVVANIGGHETIHPKSYEFIMNVCFEVRGKDLDSRQVNPLLRQFKQQLKDFKLYEGQMKCWAVRVDEFEYELINTDRAVCSYQILFRAYDPRGFSCESIKPRLLRNMRMQELRDEEKDISIQMTDSLYDGGSKKARWPRNEIGREQSF